MFVELVFRGFRFRIERRTTRKEGILAGKFDHLQCSKVDQWVLAGMLA